MLETSTDDTSSDTSCYDTSNEDTSTESTSIWMLDASATKPLPVNPLNRGHLGLFQKYKYDKYNYKLVHKLLKKHIY